MIENAGPVDLIERCLTHFTTGLHTAHNLTLSHEAERLESLPTSPTIIRMRAIVAAEQETRRAASACPVQNGAEPGRGKSRVADVLALGTAADSGRAAA